MNGTVYLRNGQAAEFVKQVDEDNYIVQPHIIFYDHEGNADYDYDQKTVVSEVFQSPPVEKISADYIKKIEAVKAKNGELLAITREIHSVQYELKKAKELMTNIEKGVINKTELKNAETIACFANNRIEPYILSEKMKRDLKIIIEITFTTGKERGWCYDFYDSDDSWSSSNFIDQKYGFIINPSEGELEEIAKQRAQKRYDSDKFSEWEIKRTDDKYLTDALIEIKLGLIQEEKAERKEKLKIEIENKKEELKKLQSNL